MSDIAISNVINVSVSTPPTGLAAYQVNNLAIFTKEVPVNGAITANAPGIYVSPADVVADWGSGSEVAAMATAIFSQSPNILDGGGQLVIFPMGNSDTLAAVIPAGFKIQFFGAAIWAGYAPNDAEVEAGAAVVAAIRVKLLVSSHLTASLTPSTGLFAILFATSNPHCRLFLYTQGATALNARVAFAAYAGRALCVDYSGTSTANTMHLKQLATIAVDTGITQTTLTAAIALGVDTYVPIAGRASVFTSGANDFWDNVANLDWLVFALTVAGFNALATTGTKLPQTEPGVAVLRGAYIDVLKQAVQNGFLAPGVWNSPELFGDPAALRRNVAEIGYYVWSLPVGLQLQADRTARKAPLIRIAAKYAGAVQSSDVIVSINQ
jgi:hypothetical protein